MIKKELILLRKTNKHIGELINKLRNTTHNIKQLGFSGLRAFVFQVNFSNDGYRRTPKTQPFHIVKR
jgi:hypothetical protein